MADLCCVAMSSTDSDFSMQGQPDEQLWDDDAELARAIALSLQDAPPPAEQGEGIPPGHAPLTSPPSRQSPPPEEPSGPAAPPHTRSDSPSDRYAADHEPLRVQSDAHPYLAAHPIAGGADTHNAVIIVSRMPTVGRQRQGR